VSEEKITDTQSTAATETGSEATAGNLSNQAETRTFTQDDVDRIVQNRLKQVEKKFEGVDLNEYQNLKQQQAEAERQSMMKREQFQELLQKQKADYESRLQQMTSELQRVHVDGALLNAASKNRAVNPEHVASLLKGQVRLGEGNQVEVLDTDGNVRYNTETAAPLTVEDAVNEFLTANPYFRAAAPAGSGSTGNATKSASREVKLTDLDMRDPEHRRLYKEKFAVGNQRSFAKK
jgi:DNA-binding transcriptional MerR regulator